MPPIRRHRALSPIGCTNSSSCYTPAGDVALWFMYQPMLVNKTTFENLTSEQQAALLAAAEKAEAFYLEEAKKADAASAAKFAEAGVTLAR